MVPEIVVAHATPRTHAHRAASRFHEFLSELNPLQYLPVIGTLYRAITGDTIPETARMVGSLVVSGLTGGPIGLAINVATVAVEKLTGLDPEKVGASLLADIGIGASTPAKAAHLLAPHLLAPHLLASDLPAPDVPAPQPPAQAAIPWSQAQLSAYGVTTAPDGTLHRGALSGSDVLNELELARTA